MVVDILCGWHDSQYLDASERVASSYDNVTGDDIRLPGIEALYLAEVMWVLIATYLLLQYTGASERYGEARSLASRGSSGSSRGPTARGLDGTPCPQTPSKF